MATATTNLDNNNDDGPDFCPDDNDYHKHDHDFNNDHDRHDLYHDDDDYRLARSPQPQTR